MTTVSQSAFASICGVSRQMVSKWKSAGWLVLQDSAVDVEATDARMKQYYSKGSPVPASALTPVDTGAASVDKPMSTARRSVNQAPAAVTAGERLALLDDTLSFEFSREALTARVEKAARFLGFEPRFDGDDIRLMFDGHQHFELIDDGFAVNAYCAIEMLRWWLAPDLPLRHEFEPALPLLARPFGTPETERACNAG